jgi:hypothetical protein
MIVQLVKKCLGVKDIASMYVLSAFLEDWVTMGALAGTCVPWLWAETGRARQPAMTHVEAPCFSQ